MFTVNIIPNDKGNPPGKLADAELLFTEPMCPDCLGDRELTIAESGPLAGATAVCATCEGHGVLVGANPLAGLKLIGFSIWERRGIHADREGSANDPGRRIVTFPARQYSINGERRSFALLRPIVDATAQERIRATILDAFAEYERQIVEVR